MSSNDRTEKKREGKKKKRPFKIQVKPACDAKLTFGREVTHGGFVHPSSEAARIFFWLVNHQKMVDKHVLT